MYPPEIFFYGGGGAAGWGSLCGALIAAGSVINMVTPLNQCMQVYGELIGWYTQEPFPSRKLDAIAKIKDQAQSVSDSPLCHVSISRWCDTSGLKVGTPEHADRCAKLSGDVAAQTVMLLNLRHEGRFETRFAVSAETTGCMGCHGGKGEQADSYGKMTCVQCHEPHETK